MHKLILITCAFLSLLFAAEAAFAETTLGVGAGIVAANSNLGTRFGYGIRAGYKPESDNYCVGLSYFRSSNSGIAINEVLANLDYAKGGMYIGGKAGISVLSASFGPYSVSDTNFAIGPEIGADFPISEMATLGPELDYIFVASSSSYQYFDGMLMLKVHF
jgi:hypothetical protein